MTTAANVAAPRESIRVFRPAGLDGVEVLHAEHTDRTWRWFHEAYCFCSYARHPGTVWQYRGKDYLTVDSGVMMLEPGEVHVSHPPARPASFDVLFVDATVLARAAWELGASSTQPHFTAALTVIPSFAAVLHRFHRSLADNSLMLAQQTLLAEALRLMLECFAEQRPPECKPDKPTVARAREYLHAHWSENVSLDDLSRASYASKFHLVRTFREVTGLPPHEYLRQIRLARARRMLAKGTAISQVALECGFADQAHLSRHFKRALGVTPGEYRRSALVGSRVSVSPPD